MADDGSSSSSKENDHKIPPSKLKSDKVKYLVGGHVKLAFLLQDQINKLPPRTITNQHQVKKVREIFELVNSYCWRTDLYFSCGCA